MFTFCLQKKALWCHQQTVYRGPDGKQLYTRLRSLCLPPQPCRDSIREATQQHENKLGQPCCSETVKHELLCGPRTSHNLSATDIHILFSRQCLIQLGLFNFRGRTERIAKSDPTSSFQSALNPQHPKIFHTSQHLHTSSAQPLPIHIQSSFCMFAFFLFFLHIELPSFHPNSCKGKSSSAFSPEDFAQDSAGIMMNTVKMLILVGFSCCEKCHGQRRH